MTNTISVFNHKGGVGKTFVTTNLATTLAVAGYKVLLIDMDFQAGQDMARMLNLSSKGSIYEIISKADTNEEGVVSK